MIRTVALRALLAAALVVTIPAATTAADTNGRPEGTLWYLVAYDAGGSELTPVPWDVEATLSLRKAGGSGFTGCNTFTADYERDGVAMSLRETGINAAGCPGDRGPVQEGYLAALPQVVRWATTPAGPTGDRELYLFGTDDEHLLRFSSSDTALLVDQIGILTDQLEAQQQEIAALQARIEELEQGS